MFTDRFIKVPVREYSRKHQELTGEEGELYDNWEKIDPDTIENYRPSLDDDGTIEDATTIYTRNGENYTIRWHWKEFERRMNEFTEKRKQQEHGL